MKKYVRIDRSNIRFNREKRATICSTRCAFTLIELLVVIVIVSILVALLLPVFASAKEHARETTCSSNMKQIGLAMMQYQEDFDELFPYRPDLKAAPSPPWGTTTYPTSDPRCAWATIVLDPYIKNADVWSCPSVADTIMGSDEHVLEVDSNGIPARYWMWPFDHGNFPLPEDDFWGKTDEQAIEGQNAVYQADLLTHTVYPKGDTTSVSDTQLMCDPYFPSTSNAQPVSLKGAAVHFGGRNNLYLDGHVAWVRDARLND